MEMPPRLVHILLNLNTYQLDGGSGSGLNQSINADIILNGVIDNMGDPGWVFSYANAIADRKISSEFPCRSVVLEGNCTCYVTARQCSSLSSVSLVSSLVFACAIF